MFLKKEDIKEKVRNIILDEKDNDIAFVIAAKGIGKINLLAEIYDVEASNRSIIIANGKRVHNSASCLSKCFIDGICSYIEKNNSPKTRENFLRQLPRGKLSTAQKISFISNAFVLKRKINITEITSYLSDLTPRQLKDIYVGIAGETPLVIFASAIWLDSIDIDYLLNLHNDNWGARVTFIIALRPTVDSLNVMKKTLEKNAPRVWVFPLLPEVVGTTNSSFPKAIAPIAIEEIGTSECYYDFYRTLTENNAYYEMYDIVYSLLREGLHPVNLCLMANQEMSIETYHALQEIVMSIYPNTKSVYDDRLVLPYDGRLLWIDALAYYIALSEGIDDAIIATQHFFLDIIAFARHFEQGSPTRERFVAFLKKSEKQNSNYLAKGFAAYYSSFATFAKNFSSKEQFEKNSNENSLMAVELLERAVLEFSDEDVDSNIKLLGEIYEESQFCAILDICLETIIRFFKKQRFPCELKETTIVSISKFQTLCMSAAYRWLDITLLDKIVALQKSIQEAGYSIKVKFKELTNPGKEMLFEHLANELEKEKMKMEDSVMRATIFLSYTHADSIIAEKIENALKVLGYDVKRDIRNVEKWEDMQEFMKSIRKQDYAVFLVSDKYLHSINCLYEIMQFMKDENFGNRSFPIAINLTKDEKNLRETQNRATSFFDAFYWIELVHYWQEYALKMETQLEKLKRENSSELDSKYRIVKELAQTAAKFFENSFDRKLIATIDPEKEDVKDIVSSIDRMISTDSSIDGNYQEQLYPLVNT